MIIPALVGITAAKNMGSIDVDGIGTIYVISPDWAADYVSVHDNGFTLSGGGRVYFADKEVDDFSDPYAYWQTPLLGKHLSYEIGNFSHTYTVVAEVKYFYIEGI